MCWTTSSLAAPPRNGLEIMSPCANWDIGPAASVVSPLRLAHRSMRTCSLAAPSQNPNAAQQMYSYFGDTTLVPAGARPISSSAVSLVIPIAPASTSFSLNRPGIRLPNLLLIAAPVEAFFEPQSTRKAETTRTFFRLFRAAIAEIARRLRRFFNHGFRGWHG